VAVPCIRKLNHAPKGIQFAMKTAEDFPYQDIISLHRRFCGRCAFLGTGAWCGCGAESVYEILAALEDGET